MVIVTPPLVKWAAGLTIFFCLPLYFTKLIRETRFPEGFSFIVMYTWGLVAVVALPAFLLVDLYLLFRALKGGPEESARRSLFITAFALCLGAAGECVFLLTRR